MHILVSIYNIKFISFFFFAFIKTIYISIYIYYTYIYIFYINIKWKSLFLVAIERISLNLVEFLSYIFIKLENKNYCGLQILSNYD